MVSKTKGAAMDKIRNWRVRSGERWQKQTDMQRWTVKILVALAVVAALSVLPSLFAGDWQGFLLNLGIELGGAVVTFILINRIIGGGEERERLKADLMARMRSQVNEVAVQAAEELRRYGWLTDGSLQAVNLQSAKLQRADLKGANLQRVNLERADLQRVQLEGSDLQGAKLRSANLEAAKLSFANLQMADLHSANLYYANLWDSDLQGANLQHANLQRADLLNVRFDENTILPDGTCWTPDTHIGHFTDPDHPNFWLGYEVCHAETNVDSNWMGANLQGADLMFTYLRGATLSRANLQEADLCDAFLKGADLKHANLQGASLSGAKFDEETVLPDGSKWAPDTDMARFTDPAHPDFWRSDDPDSPAYRDDSNQGG